MKITKGRSLEQASELINVLNEFGKKDHRVAQIPVMPHTKGTQFLIGETTLVLTYSPTAKQHSQVLYDWYAIDSQGMQEAKSLVRDAYHLANLPFTEEVNYY